MNLEKAKKRIAKKVKMGEKGYPELSIRYTGPNLSLAQEVILEFILDEGVPPAEERFTSTDDARENEVIQSAIVKVMERSGAKTIRLIDTIEVIQ